MVHHENDRAEDGKGEVHPDIQQDYTLNRVIVLCIHLMDIVLIWLRIKVREHAR